MGLEQSVEDLVEESFTTESFIQLEALAYTSSPDDDFRDLRPIYLDKFIAEQLQPNESFHRLFSTALDTLCRYIHKRMRPPTVKRLIKGGSMGKGTALRGRSDLDCILIMNDVKDARDLKMKIYGILAQLEELLETDPLRDDGWGISVSRSNRFMLQIKMYNFQRDESVEVDILPTFDAEAKYGYSRDQLYDLMKGYDYDTQQYCSAALAELQREFIKPKPAKLKNLIRLVKHWCKTYLPREYGQPRVPNSYLLELLTIDVWEKAGSPRSFTTALLFKNVMEALFNHRQLNVKWEKYYSPIWIQSQKPYIMDPANPYNNMYEFVGDWERVKRTARETLKKPLLQSYGSSVLESEKSRSAKCFIVSVFIILCICLLIFILFHS